LTNSALTDGAVQAKNRWREWTWAVDRSQRQQTGGDVYGVGVAPGVTVTGAVAYLLNYRDMFAANKLAFWLNRGGLVAGWLAYSMWWLTTSAVSF